MNFLIRHSKLNCGENKNIVLSFGIHPQLCTTDVDFDSLFNFLEGMVEKREVNVIGEAGFDYFLDDFKEKKDLQDELFEKQIDLAIVGPDDPLVAGLVDVLNTAGIKAFGPEKKAAIMELLCRTKEPLILKQLKM